MPCYLSIDTEATGLEKDTHLIQLAMVPVDPKGKKVHEELGFETLVKCPSFEELRPNLNTWVVKHNEGLIRQAHAEGVDPKELPSIVREYLNRKEVKALFPDSKAMLLGKSLCALDIYLLRKYLGYDTCDELFHHHTVDITGIAHFMVNAGWLPKGCESTTKIIRHFGIREDARHTALSDALDMGNIFLQLIERFQKKENLS